MFALEEPKIKLSKIILFNRYLYAVLILGLLIYTVQLNTHKNAGTYLLILACWLSLGLHAFLNEGIRQIIKKSVIATSEVCLILARFNTILTAVLISIITVCTGNPAYSFLLLIPIFHNLFSSGIKFSWGIFTVSTIIMTGLDLTGWFKNDFLIVNKNIIQFNAFINIMIIGLIGYLGIILSSQSRHHSHKASLFHNMATTDALTGLMNRREFNRRITEEIIRTKRHKSLLSLALFDIDFFKKINDTYGHPAGDDLLKELGKLISMNIRGCDIAARYGGEEFALILPETTQIEAYELLERLRIMIENHIFYVSYTQIKTTVSIGIAQYNSMDSCVADLCERTDKALYSAKNNGRNRVEIAAFGLPKLDLSKVLVN